MCGFPLASELPSNHLSVMQVQDIKQVACEPFRPFAVRLVNGVQYGFNKPGKLAPRVTIE
jgi:hypothetical protein